MSSAIHVSKLAFPVFEDIVFKLVVKMGQQKAQIWVNACYKYESAILKIPVNNLIKVCDDIVKNGWKASLIKCVIYGVGNKAYKNENGNTFCLLRL